ncbi:hypothetical protein VRZ08_01035 [Rhodopseudomonas sp. G2_2311]|uniref:hypothetical protein n=1 Tax=Rhodopseudomonas sp. G2_2311 TaxID=3114287 RepID=UPI0039C641F4
MIDAKHIPLRIETMPHGGFIITEAHQRTGDYCASLFACTSIGEALDFIRARLAPDERAAITSPTVPFPSNAHAFNGCGL